MSKPCRVIAEGIRKGRLPQGYELTSNDVGKIVEWNSGFGLVRGFDVGKLVWLKGYGIIMENNEQMEKRKANP